MEANPLRTESPDKLTVPATETMESLVADETLFEWLLCADPEESE